MDVGEYSYEEFKRDFVANGGCPVIIRGVIEEGSWRAKEYWKSAEELVKNYGDIPVKVMEKRPEHGMGRSFLVRIPLALYYEYSKDNTADDPFYAFEHDFSEGRAVFISDYEAPRFFKEDLYNYNDRTREFYPNYRHLIIGGERTGTNLHVDPKCTGAWNTLLAGHKKWAIFPPGPDKIDRLSINSYAKKPTTYWWQDVLPGVSDDMGMIECIQNPGETIFIPAGWWHAALNLDFTIAITENLLIPITLPFVWADLRDGWQKFTEYLEETAPELVGKIASSVPASTTKTKFSTIY